MFEGITRSLGDALKKLRGQIKKLYPKATEHSITPFGIMLIPRR